MIRFRRLQVIETFLRTRASLLKGKFDLGEWVPQEDELVDKFFPKGETSTFQANQKTLDCGFAGCVIGWAAVLKPFQHLGLYLERADDEPLIVIPMFDGYSNWRAVQELFGLSLEEAYYLFSKHEYPPDGSHTDPLYVAARIREFIAEHRPKDSPCSYLPKESN